jgi:phytanoyl-CoA hydroxylase
MKTAQCPELSDLEKYKQQMDTQGYVHAQGLFSPDEVEEIKALYTEMHRTGIPGFYEPDREAEDPLKRWPRIEHPHRFDERSRYYMIHAALRACLEAFLGPDPIATQSMYYFKPPGARGQALHQDNFYLMVQPGTCMAAWVAIDDCDHENGAMMVVPGSQYSDVVCPEKANESVSFTSEFVPVPKGLKAELVRMKAGDVLFFNGSLIHGSGPNRSATRFRRSFICHYVAGSTERISKFYNPLVTMDGEDLSMAPAIGGGPCGTTWGGAKH